MNEHAKKALYLDGLKEQYNSISGLAMQTCIEIIENRDFKTVFKNHVDTSFLLMFAVANIMQVSMPVLSAHLYALYYLIKISDKDPEKVIEAIRKLNDELIDINGIRDKLDEYIKQENSKLN